MEQRIWQNSDSSVNNIRIIQPMSIVYPCNDKSHEIWQQLCGFRIENSGIPFIVYRHINNKFCLFEITSKRNAYYRNIGHALVVPTIRFRYWLWIFKSFTKMERQRKKHLPVAKLQRFAIKIVFSFRLSLSGWFYCWTVCTLATCIVGVVLESSWVE